MPSAPGHSKLGIDLPNELLREFRNHTDTGNRTKVVKRLIESFVVLSRANPNLQWAIVSGLVRFTIVKGDKLGLPTKEEQP